MNTKNLPGDKAQPERRLIKNCMKKPMGHAENKVEEKEI
jgi:hypothetical protein